MPIFLKKNILPEGVIGVWEITEEESFFKGLLNLEQEEIELIDSLRGRRKIEWLASRYLLHLLSARHKRGKLLKDEFGKPYLEDSSYHVSLSHSHNFVAVIASPKKVGIDIQIHVDKILRISEKFVNEAEQAYLHQYEYYIPSIHIIWGAKECLYKAYGRKQIDFKKHLRIGSFSFDTDIAKPIRSFLQKDRLNEEYDVYFECFNNYYLVYAIQH